MAKTPASALYDLPVRQSLHGHFWTLAPHVVHLVAPERAPLDEPWETHVDDPRLGSLRLTGRLRARTGGDSIVVLIHGLGGSAESRYVLRAARACDEHGLSYLRFNMRGADRSGEDIYHAGQTDDLRAMLRSGQLASFEHIYLFGYSLGGHIAVRWATEPDRDPRVRAIAALCSPLDLRYGAHSIQRPGGWPYQWHVLRGLKEMYRAAKGRRPLPIPIERAEAIRTILEWDEEVIVPRFGFASLAHYYESQSAGPRLAAMEVPTLFIAAEADPVVTADQLRPWLARTSNAVEVAWTDGGHVAFPDLDLGGRDVGPLEPQILRWLEARH
jgi:predicted alpha/beta-fold hydrolase